MALNVSWIENCVRPMTSEGPLAIIFALGREDSYDFFFKL